MPKNSPSNSKTPAPALAVASPRPTPATTLPFWVTPTLIAATKQVWQPYYTRPLTEEEAIQILLSVGRLFGALAPKPS